MTFPELACIVLGWFFLIVAVAALWQGIRRRLPRTRARQVASTQNARLYPYGHLHIGKCSICGDRTPVLVVGSMTTRAFVRMWSEFVWKHEGCMREPPLTLEEEVWLRGELERCRR